MPFRPDTTGYCRYAYRQTGVWRSGFSLQPEDAPLGGAADQFPPVAGSQGKPDRSRDGAVGYEVAGGRFGLGGAPRQLQGALPLREAEQLGLGADPEVLEIR